MGWLQDPNSVPLAENALGSDDNALAATQTLFRDIIEPLCDSFTPGAVDEYNSLFARIIAAALPGYHERDLLRRYESIRQARVYAGQPERVCVLSRVTLGADVAVTSVLLDAAKRRFPNAQVCLVGPPKNLELFPADEDIVRVPAPYARSGLLRDRLEASQRLRDVVDQTGTFVIDPDSRLTQLGLIPVCEDDQYLFFESRAYGVESGRSLPALAADWARHTLGVENARAYLAPLTQPSRAAITVSLGVGENEEKRISNQFELVILSHLASFGVPVLVDSGAGGDEAKRVNDLVLALNNRKNIEVYHGSFASFASQIMQSKLYFGYDSAGQHVAAASGVPLVTVFAGYACERTFERWYPTGRGPIHVLKNRPLDPRRVTEETLDAITLAAVEAGLS